MGPEPGSADPRHNCRMKHLPNRRRPTALGLGAAVLVVAALVVGILLLPGRGGETEVEGLTRLLDLQPGDSVADVGAGDGWLSLEVARRVGRAGHVFATELSAARRDDIRAAIAGAGLDNITVVEAGVRDTNLASACCDAIFQRRVYHHLTDPEATNASLYAALKPGGRLAIIELEFSGLFGFLRAWPHWTDDEQVVAEVAAAGFTHVATADWPVAAHYAAVFRK